MLTNNKMDESTITISDYKDLSHVVQTSVPLSKNNNILEKIMKNKQQPKFEMNVERRKLLMMIKKYKSSRFCEYLNSLEINLNDEELIKLSNEQLEKLIDDIRYSVSQKNSSNVVETAAIKGIETIESFLTNIYKIDGLSKVLKNNESFLDTMTELSLEYSSLSYISPEKRLAFIIISNGFLVHQSHSFFAELSKSEQGKQQIIEMQKKIDEDMKKE